MSPDIESSHCSLYPRSNWNFPKLSCVTQVLAENSCSRWRQPPPQTSPTFSWVFLSSFSICSQNTLCCGHTNPYEMSGHGTIKNILWAVPQGLLDTSTAPGMATSVTLVWKYKQKLLTLYHEEYTLLKSQLRHLTSNVNLVKVLNLNEP